MTEDEVIEVIEDIIISIHTQDVVKEIGMTCLMKLYTKFKTQEVQISNLIESQTQSGSIELQQRACEYKRLIDNNWSKSQDGLFEMVPISKVI